MAHNVKCPICGKTFDRDKVPFVQVSPRRYAHKECSMSEDERKTQEIKDKEELDNYIMSLFKMTYVDARIQKQIKKYVDENNYTYSGIKKALVYFFEIKGNSVEKANGGIGIVPYVYQQAYNYYYSLWLAQQKNEDKVVEEYVPIVKEIIIPVPERKVRKRPLFSFLDEEGEI
ncbi:MAG: hypothetical protein E7167_02030 [Firmicutes bacterium]|nr:hypothetical protein [Bacillota bacterium]